MAAVYDLETSAPQRGVSTDMTHVAQSAAQSADDFEVGPVFRAATGDHEIAIHTYIADGAVTFDVSPPDEPVPLDEAPRLVAAIRSMVSEMERRVSQN